MRVTYQLEVLETQIKALIDKNVTTQLNQDDYLKAYEPLAERYKAINKELQEQADARQSMNIRRQNAMAFMRTMQNQKSKMTEFDEGQWHLLIDTVTVHAGRLVLKFKNGLEIQKTI